MIKNILTRYSFRYPRSLIYMLQASEYSIGEYVLWYHATANFNHVEKRKTFVKTGKSVGLLVLAWLILITLYIAACSYAFAGGTSLSYGIGIIGIILAPFILAYLIIVPLVFLQLLVQKPIQYFIIRSAQKKLAAHKGIKIAIAGSYGKTSMREILKTVLAEGKKVAAPPHSYNTLLGISTFIKGLSGDEEVLIFELGEYYPGDIRDLCNLVHPDMGIITGVNEAHLEKFKTIERTTATIFELADALGQKPLYVNGENVLSKNAASHTAVVYSREGAGSVKIHSGHTGLAGTSFVATTSGKDENMHSELLGFHQLGPLAASIAIALSLSLPIEKIKTGISKTKPFDHRLTPYTDANGVVTLDDSYNGNPDGVTAVIDFLSELQGHRRFYVTPGLVEMGRRTEEVHVEIGRQIATAGIEKTILVRNSVTPYIEKGLKESHYKGEIIWFPDGLSALKALPLMSVTGDVFLLQNDWPDQYR